MASDFLQPFWGKLHPISPSSDPPLPLRLPLPFPLTWFQTPVRGHSLSHSGSEQLSFDFPHHRWDSRLLVIPLPHHLTPVLTQPLIPTLTPTPIVLKANEHRYWLTWHYLGPAVKKATQQAWRVNLTPGSFVGHRKSHLTAFYGRAPQAPSRPLARAWPLSAFHSWVEWNMAWGARYAFKRTTWTAEDKEC